MKTSESGVALMKEVNSVSESTIEIWEFDCSKCSQNGKNGNLCDLCKLTKKLQENSNDRCI